MVAVIHKTAAFSWKELMKLAQHLQEAMRMLPVLGDGTNRTTQRDMVIGNYNIPKGTMVWIPFNAVFNSSHNWREPDRYWPVSRQLPSASLQVPSQAAPCISLWLGCCRTEDPAWGGGRSDGSRQVQRMPLLLTMHPNKQGPFECTPMLQARLTSQLQQSQRH